MVGHNYGDRMGESLLRRIYRTIPEPVVDRLASLPGADLGTLLMEVARRRAASVQAASVLRRHAENRFVRPAVIDLRARHRIEAALLGALPGEFQTVVLAPMVPFASHSAVAGVHQNRVVATTRTTEVAADPTIGLALVASEQRRKLLRTNARSPERVRLATIQRISRAQRFDGPRSWAHFDVFGLVTAGRDQGHDRFEIETLTEHVDIMAEAVAAAGAEAIRVDLTDFTDGAFSHVVESMLERTESSNVQMAVDPDRQAGKGYYPTVAFKLFASFGDGPIEMADGGFVDWTQRLVESRKERLMTSGLGMDRLVLAAATGP